MTSKRSRAIGAMVLAAMMASTTFLLAACDEKGSDPVVGTAYTLTYTAEDPLAGSVSGSPVSGSALSAGAAFSLLATANSGYTFLGWYEGETSVSTASSFNGYMPAKNYTLTAKFSDGSATPSADSYPLTYRSDDTSKGRVSGTVQSGVTLKAGTSVTLVATAAAEYRFVGWYEGESSVSDETTYTFEMPAKERSLVARFEPIPVTKYTLTYFVNDSKMGSVDCASDSGEQLNAGSHVMLVATATKDHVFVGYFEDGTLLCDDLTYKFDINKDMNIEARFRIADKSTVSVVTDTEGGENGGKAELFVNGSSLPSGSPLSEGTSLSAKATPSLGYVFKGWKSSDSDDPDTIVETSLSYRLKMTADSLTLTAVFVHSYTYEKDDETGEEYVYYGMYPQSLKASNVEIQGEPNAFGFYMGSDGFFYKKVTATTAYTSATFRDNTTPVVNGEEYYFKVEPIKWRILEQVDGNAHLFCENILDRVVYQSNYELVPISSYETEAVTHAYNAPEGTYMNNYQFSELRHWLNNDFRNIAFSNVVEGTLIKFGVDNSGAMSPSGLDGSTNPYTCPDTQDYVTALSWMELYTHELGFADPSSSGGGNGQLTEDPNRALPATDYAIALGSDSKYSGYWTRTPYVWDDYSDSYGHVDAAVCVVAAKGQLNLSKGALQWPRGEDGELDKAHPFIDDCGVVPSIWMSMGELSDGTTFNPDGLSFPANDPAVSYTSGVAEAIYSLGDIALSEER